MSTELRPALRPLPSDLGRLLLLPALAGVGLALADLAMTELARTTQVDRPWANLANSSAVWALAAFAIGAVLRTDPARAALAGVVLLVVAVETYYAAAALLDLAGYRAMWSAAAQMWLTFAVLAGTVFGTAGAWTRSTSWWPRVLGTTLGAAIALGEAVHLLRNLRERHLHFHTQLEDTAILLALLGLAVLVVSARRPSVLAAAAVLSLPAALCCAAAFAAVGVAY